MIKCQYCGTEKCHPEYHEMMGRVLCMRCTDKLLSMINGRYFDELWKDDFAIKEGLDKFVLPEPYLLDYLRKRVDLMSPVMKLDYNFRKGYDL